MPKKSLAGPGTAHVAEAFKARKIELGRSKSLRVIERDTGLSRETINRSLSGKSAIALDTFLRMCRVLHLDPVRLIREAARLDTALDARVAVVGPEGVLAKPATKRQPRESK